MSMKKKTCAIALAILAIVGGFANFYFTNIAMNAAANKDSPWFLLRIIEAVPGVMFNCQIILAMFFIYRLYLHPTHKYKLLSLYSIILACLGGIGVITTILSGTLLYGSFIKPYPFAGFHIIMLIWHLITIFLAFANLLYFRKYYIDEQDIIIKKTDYKHVFTTIFLSLVFYYTLNRFGAFLWSPTYILWRNIVDTYPFYLSLLLPLAILIHDMLYVFNIYKKKVAAKVGIAVSSGIVVLSLFFFVQIFTRGSLDTQFIASISPAVPIERLLTFPIDTILSAVLVIGLGLFTLYDSIVFSRAKDKDPTVD